MVSGPVTARQIEGGKVEVLTDFLFLGSKITADVDCSHEIRRRLLFVRKALTNLDSVEKLRHCRQRSLYLRLWSSQWLCMVVELDCREGRMPKN